MSEPLAVTQRGFLDFSPVRRDKENNKENDVPVLSLIQFSRAPFLTFGAVKLGTSKAALLRIENPTEDAEAEVTVEKIPSSKGFSVDRRTFTIEPGGSFGLTVTWTPAEEGGIRELLIISANGVVKHQAVMLGRAEAPKKKKKSLWDTIKNKREDGKAAAPPRKKKTDQPLKMASNKTFQVIRKSQYRRDKPRSPLSSVNEDRAVRKRSVSRTGPLDLYPLKPEQMKVLKPTQRSVMSSDLDGVHHTRRISPDDLLIPSGKLMDSGNMSASPASLMGKPVSKDLVSVLNATLSPIGTPERFKKLMPHIYSERPPSDDADGVSPGAEVPSLKDALALIDSDLNASPGDSSSSCGFSDSLESKSGNRAFKASSVSPRGSEPGEPRLTFFVSKNVVTDAFVCNADEAGKVKKASFTSATVTKGKAPDAADGSSGRKIKKSRRRLLERTLELSEGSSQSESGPETPRLPVIEPGIVGRQDPTCDDTAAPVTFPLPVAPSRFSFSPISPSPATIAITSPTLTPFPLGSSSPLPPTSNPGIHEPRSPSSAPLYVQEESFPIHLAVNSKKRKSEEYLKRDGGKVEDAGKTACAKRSRAAAAKIVQERRLQTRAGSVRPTPSLKKKEPSAIPAQAIQPRSKPAARGVRPVKLTGVSSGKTKRVVAVAQSKLTFIKPVQTAIPRHPMPFAAKNMFYDERWVEKQERGFTWWINYVLTPDDFKVNTEVAKVNAVSIAMGGGDGKFSVPKAPTREEMSFSTYTARRKLNRLRRAACQLFTSEAMAKAIQRLELEVEARRLLIRKDRHLWRDIGERTKVLNWLLSYNPLWLRIGLETIYGELISLESNSDALGLAMFILQRLLWNPDIAAEFRHAKVPHLYKDGHEEALSRFTLKKLLLLVCFLDKAKESRLIEHNPCLFCPDAEFKTSKDLLLAFSRDFLSGEGILSRHLGYLGFPVSHVQTPLDEFNFAVKNLAVDLKCGIRLVRVMELLVQDWSLSSKLRLPAISRLQKVHNVDIALQVLRSKGVDLKDEHGSAIDSRDVVDGHREKTLSLLWKIIFAFHVEVILDEHQLREEISFLQTTLRTKRRLAALKADQGWQSGGAAATRTPYEHGSAKVALLMEWVRAVSDFYSLKVENFTVAFSDGRVLCCLIHRYHPSLLPEGAVSHSTTQTVECSPRGRLELSCSASDSDGSFDSGPTGVNGPFSPSVEFKELLENEKNNFRLINTAVSFLGGVPAMINPADMSNTIPNEKVVLSYLSFLCARLLDLRNETRAARVIQDAWRKYKLKKDLQTYQERNSAAVKIQLLVRTFLQRRRAERQNRAAVLIQSVWRGFATRNRLRLEKRAQLLALQHKAAAVIQAQWRMFSAVKAYKRLNHYVIVVQAQWRMRRAASAYGRIYWATTVIQKYWRASVLAREERKHYLCLRNAAVQTQRRYRRWKTQKMETENGAARVIQAAFKKWCEAKLAKRRAAAVRIQSWYRRHRCCYQYRTLKRSAVLIQARCRGHAQRRRFQALKLQHRSAVVIQSAFRGHAVRKQVAEIRCAAVIIQRWFRASVERQAFVRMRCAAIAIQAAYRGKVSRESLKMQHKAATAIQAAFRKRAAQTRYRLLREAAVVIQRKYKATILARSTKKDYDALRYAALTVQANWRGRAVRRRMGTWHRCATLIQANYRRHKAQSEYRSKKAAAEVIQRRFRARMVGNDTRKAYLRVRAACVTVQAGFRGMRVRTELKKKHQAATIIQASVRMFLCKNKYVLLQSAAVIIQSRYRALVACRACQNKYRRVKQAAMTLQSAYRGFRVRRELQRRHRAARAIQAQFRMHRIQVAYLATKCAAIIIQERYRAKMLRGKDWRRYRDMKSAAVVIQAAYRGHRARRMMGDMHRAAAIIQRKFLAIRDRKRFLAIKAAASVCQQRYRRGILARKDRSDYLSKRRAIIRLQAAYRGCKIRKQLHTQHAAAVRIQSHFRKYRDRKNFKKLHWAARVLQARYRATKKMREEMQSLTVKRNAAVVLQAAFRGMKSRQIIRQKHQAASVVQRAYRTHCQHKEFLTLKSLVLTVQRRYRATVAAKEQMREYQTLRKAAVLLQAVYRGQQARKEVCVWNQAATIIQSAFRRHREEVKFQAMRLSAIIIQRRYRSCLLQRQERKKFLEIRHSAVVLQAAFRGLCVRHNIAKMHKAATVIQAYFKRYQQQTVFRKQRWAVRILQQRFRANRERNVEVKHYQDVRTAVINLQAAFRGMKSRRLIKQRHWAASVVQRAYRTRCLRKKFLTLKSSVLTVQRRYRATVAAKEQMREYQTLRKAAVLLQAAYRGQQVRKEVRVWNQAATVIQSAFRRHREEVKFQAMRLSAIIIQRRYRSCLLQRQERKKFLEIRHSAVVLQAAFRGLCVRHNIAKMHKAATVIQAYFKRYQQQAVFRKQRWAVCVLQQRFRANRERNIEVKHYQDVRTAVINLQAAFRGMKSRRIIRQKHQAASVVQRAYRTHCLHKEFLTLKSSVLTVQRRYRATVAAKEQMREYETLRKAAVLLQAVYRGQQARKEVCVWNQAATIIQSAFRRHREEVKFQAMRLSAIIIQRRYRSCLLQRQERKKFLEIRRSAVVLQAAFRGLCVRHNIAKMHKAATVIQANFKRYQQQTVFRRQRWAVRILQQRFRANMQRNVEVKHYQDVRTAVINLQAAFRGMKSRRLIKQRHWAASVVQRAYRTRCLRKKFLTLKSSVLTVQRRYRATVAAKEQMREYQKRRKAAVLLQAVYRGQQARKEVRVWNQAATVIQSAFRRHREEVKFQAMRLSAIIIQRRYRSCLLQRQERKKFLEIRRSAVVLQAALRGWLVRRDIRCQNQAAVVIQSYWRCSVQRQIFERKREAAVKLQRWVRAVQRRRLERSNYIRMRRAAITLQTHYRAWIARRKALEAAKAERRLRFASAVFHHVSAIKIQRALRAHWALESARRQIHCVVTIQRWVRSMQQRKRYLEDRRKVVLAQRAVRRWLACRHKAASVIQKTIRKFLLLRRQRRVEQGILKAQALWRGYRSRQLNDNPKVVKLRHRLLKVSAAVREEDKLRNKTSSALEFLLRYKHFSYILEALKNLETATRLSPECCERLVESGAIDVIFTLIRCCNRSVPCMDVITFSIQILLNLSKYHKTTAAVYSVENSVETLLDLLQRYREKAGDKVADKGGSIFTKTCFLLALLLQDKHRAVEVMKLPKVLDRISSIYRLTARKHKMDAERTVIKQKMNASVNGSFFIQATPRKSRPPPKFAPDWVLRKDKLKDVVDPLRAIQMVANTLSIVL
ncbi:abnormal spindle-like microcephaly-associated protein [Antennarius striatus]|uniref:abnormal spindle-like microcephaly-associated protein n=1 Tax=Antennarius striatus TaxID=241820 RepID=UPI0035B04C2E